MCPLPRVCWLDSDYLVSAWQDYDEEAVVTATESLLNIDPEGAVVYAFEGMPSAHTGELA